LNTTIHLLSEKFTDSDFAEINKLPRSIFLFLLFILMICIPSSFLLGLLGLLKKGPGYWPVTILLLCIFILTAVFQAIRDYIRYKKDVSKQIKWVGNIAVKSKSTKKGEYNIKVDSPNIKKLNLLSQKNFAKVNEGDLLYIEISKYSKHIFLLIKE
jgi:hypothetical protein